MQETKKKCQIDEDEFFGIMRYAIDDYKFLQLTMIFVSKIFDLYGEIPKEK